MQSQKDKDNTQSSDGFTGFRMSILIKNGVVVNEDDMFNADVLIEDGIIV